MVSVRAYTIASMVVFVGMAARAGFAQLPDNGQPGTGSAYTSTSSPETANPLPADRNVQMNIRAVATDPTSAITHMVNVLITAVEVQGNQVAWHVTQLFVRRIGALGQVEVTWSADQPVINTSDGLWWVDHADPLNPVTSEFTVFPLTVGKALSLDPTVADMQYLLEGSPYVAPPQGSLFAVTGALTYTLAREDDPATPEAEGDDEEIELPTPPDEPYPA